MVSAIPLAYAAQHIYADQSPYAPVVRTRSHRLDRSRRRKVLGRRRRAPFPRPAFLTRRAAPGS